jgi:hypothetical protein
MKLCNAILRPGRVREVVDNNGTIKVSAPGLFSETDDTNLLPPVTPFLTSHTNQFSKPIVDDEVWVINFTDNLQQLYWFRKDNFAENNKKILEEENVEVLCNRETGEMGWATIYFSDNSGWMIRNDKSFIQINQDGEIIINQEWPNRCININNENISIGSKGKSAHPAAYADVIEDLLWKIYMTFEAIKTSSQTNPYTSSIASAIDIIGDWSDKISDIKSQHVTLD